MLWSHPLMSPPASSLCPFPPCCHLCGNSWPLCIYIALCTKYNTTAEILSISISPPTVTASVRQRVTCCGSPSTLWNSMPWVSRFTWAKSMICLYKPTTINDFDENSKAVMVYCHGGFWSTLIAILQYLDWTTFLSLNLLYKYFSNIQFTHIHKNCRTFFIGIYYDHGFVLVYSFCMA